MISAEELRELVHYDQDSGVFTRLKRTSPKARAGVVAGGLTPEEYWRIGVDGRRYLAHRLAFLYMTGAWPEHDVDHINGVRTDNRWVNLRAATRSENNQNRGRLVAGTKSGLLGAHWSAGDSKWLARITINKKTHTLGRFASAIEAHAAYLAAKASIHPFSSRTKEQA